MLSVSAFLKKKANKTSFLSDFTSCITSIWMCLVQQEACARKKSKNQHEIIHFEYLKDNVGLWRAFAMKNAQN